MRLCWVQWSSSCCSMHHSTSLERKDKFETGLYFLCRGLEPVFLRRGLTMACFQSVMKCPLLSDMLTMHVIVGRQAVITPFSISVLMWSSLQFLFFIPIISLLTSPSVSGLKVVSFGVFVSLGWYCGVPVKDSYIVILLEKNLAKSSAISSLVLPGGSGLWIFHPVRLFTILNNSLVFLLLSIICLVIIWFFLCVEFQ